MKKLLIVFLFAFVLSGCRNPEVFYIRNYSGNKLNVILVFQAYSARSLNKIAYSSKLISNLVFSEYETIDSIPFRVSKDERKVAFEMQPQSTACIGRGSGMGKI